MKKIFVIAMALMMVAGMAYAEDRLSLSGQYYIRGWDKEDYNKGAEESYFDQRFRLGGKIAIADDVSMNFRMDIAEGKWGYDFTDGAVARPGTGNPDRVNTKLDVDRTFLKIDKDMWDLTAGQQYMALGVAQVLDINATGFNLGFKFNDMMRLSLLYSKRSENGGLTDEDSTAAADVYEPYFNPETGLYEVDPDGPAISAGDTVSTEDLDIYAVNFSYTADAFNLKAFYAMANDGTPVDDSPWAFGVNAGTTLGMVNLNGEVAFLGGDTAAGAIDYKGLQIFVGADAQLTEMVKVGAELFYAQGTDDPTEWQLTNLGDWDTFTPLGYNTPEDGWISGMPSWDVFDPFGTMAGVMGIAISGDFTIMEGLTAGAKIGYFEPEEDVITDGDLLAYNAWVKYMIATNTYVSLTYLVSDADVEGLYDDAATTLVGRLAVNF